MSAKIHARSETGDPLCWKQLAMTGNGGYYATMTNAVPAVTCKNCLRLLGINAAVAVPPTAVAVTK